jgi:hypothetical protein
MSDRRGTPPAIILAAVSATSRQPAEQQSPPCAARAVIGVGGDPAQPEPEGQEHGQQARPGEQQDHHRGGHQSSVSAWWRRRGIAILWLIDPRCTGLQVDSCSTTRVSCTANDCNNVMETGSAAIT